MRLLADTHTLIWYVLGDSRLSGVAAKAIQDGQNEVLVSPASFWEIAIKLSTGKLRFRSSFEDFIDAILISHRFAVLVPTPNHFIGLAQLPYLPNHRDPFDRMLVA